ncbi:hypothetical protein D3C87_1455130 [compost metagenome]
MTAIELSEERQVRMSMRIFYSIIASTVMTVSVVLGTYFALKITDRDLANKNDMQDLQYQVLKIQVDKLEIEMKDLKNKVDSKADK